MLQELIVIIPLLFGLTTDSSWQVSFCNIEIINQLEFLECDELRDTLHLDAGTNMNIEADDSTDTLNFSANAIAIISSNDTTYDTKGGTFVASPTLNHLWFTSDGSIFIEFYNYTGGEQ